MEIIIIIIGLVFIFCGIYIAEILNEKRPENCAKFCTQCGCPTKEVWVGNIKYDPETGVGTKKARLYIVCSYLDESPHYQQKTKATKIFNYKGCE